MSIRSIVRLVWERLRDRRPRPGCLVLGALGSLVFAALAAFVLSLASTTDRVAETTATKALARESAAALHVGLVRESRDVRPIPLGMERHELTILVRAGECVAVIAASSGGYRVDNVHIETSAPEVDRIDAERTEGVARHAQWCSTHDATWKVAIAIDRTSPLADDARESGTLYFEVHRGRPARGLLALNRARPTPETGRRVLPATLMDASVRRAGARSPLGTDLGITGFRARLVPETRAAYAELHARARNGQSVYVSPEFEPLPLDWPASFRPLAGAGAPSLLADLARGLDFDAKRVHRAVAFDGRTPARVLAVVDADALDRCVEVHLVRLIFGYGSTVRGRNDAVLPRDAGLYADRLCPGMGRVVYRVPASDQERYRLRVFAD